MYCLRIVGVSCGVRDVPGRELVDRVGPALAQGGGAGEGTFYTEPALGTPAIAPFIVARAGGPLAPSHGPDLQPLLALGLWLLLLACSRGKRPARKCQKAQ